MRSDIFTVALLLFSSTPSLAAPHPISDVQVLERDDAAAVEARDTSLFADISDLWKRKGGGGGGGKGGGGSSSGSGSSSSGSGSSSSGSGSSSSGSGSSSGSSSSGGKTGGSSGSTGKGSSSSNTGGSTKQGSGTQPSYGGGRYYGGGATAPYSAGGRSPLGIAPVFLGVGALALFPGIWLYGAYNYPYHNPYTFHNRSAHKNTTNSTSTRRDLSGPIPVELLAPRQDSDDQGVNQTKAVQCLCAAYAECGCDDNGNTTFLDSLIGDGSYAGLNHSLISVVDFPNGTSIIALNGTLENGTTASGGTEDVNGTSAAVRTLVQVSGYWVMVALVGATVLMV